MGKRSDFERVERDFYPTPKEALIPLLPYLNDVHTFAEPCAGDGQLVGLLQREGFKCNHASDVEPRDTNIQQIDVLDNFQINSTSDVIITNPPWDRKILHPMIDVFKSVLPTWLLFDADWMHTKQSIPYIKYCSDIVSVGRLKWIPDSKMTGKDNCSWYRFIGEETETIFHGRKT